VTTLDPYTFGNRPPILLTEADRLHLRALVATAPQDDPIVMRFLQEELGRAETVAEGVAGVVTMGSMVKFDDHRSPRMRHCKLVYPDEAFDHHSVSVLSVLGVALLGLGVGQSITWTDDVHQQQRITILEITPRTIEPEV
jgi:regulator of nucleoside diphosphate kinase